MRPLPLTPAFDQSSAWKALLAHRDRLAGTTLAALWSADERRGEAFTVGCAGLAVDLSRQRLDAETLALLLALARERALPEAIAALFAGEPLNASERRPALHAALRGDERVSVGGEDIRPAILRARERVRVFAQAVREGHWRGATGRPIRHVLALGIGGSSLGPRLVVEALAEASAGPETRFVANVDPAELDRALAGLDPESTLVVVASKTFTTQETMANARAARAWLEARLGAGALERHIVAATARPEEAARWGLPESNVFAFADWVGGRFSLWSSVGLPAAIAIGPGAFERLLAGAHAVDLEFRSSPLERNAPVLLALAAIWNRNALGIASQVVIPYAARLALLPAYLQQLEMESNGKRVDRDGRPLAFATAPAVWGEAGTPGQHAFHQWLHQGTEAADCEFVVVARPMGSRAAEHEVLLSHALAQSEALLTGTAADGAHAACPGDRPCTTIVLPALEAFHLGALLALHEHKVFAEAVLWGVNPFDQWGVELGKRIALDVLPALRGGSPGLHPATRHLLALVHKAARSD